MLLFGTAGIPLAAKGLTTTEGIKSVRRLGLGAMELEFVHSVNISENKTAEVRKTAEENGIALTCHGQYYINMNAAEKVKLEASKQRLLKAAQIAWLCGARSVAFHPGYYMKSTRQEAYERVKSAIKYVVGKLKQQGNGIMIAPETTGKHTQFGNLAEVLKLSQEIEQVLPCVDYAHLRARERWNDKAAFSKMLGAVEEALGKEALKKMHIQIAGVNFSSKGELNHLNIKDSDLNYRAIVQTWKDFGVQGVVISESPSIEGDALLLKREYENA